MINNCFVIMPFGGDFNSYYNKIISPAIEEFGLNSIRGDEIYSTKPIIEDICKQIYQAKVIIADVSTKNPNVNYELGIAHSLNKPVIIISKSIDDVPFDYRHRRVLIYDTSEVDWSRKLHKKIVRTLSSIKSFKEEDVFNLKNNVHYEIVNTFLTNIQRKYSYEISKEKTVYSDNVGNCKIDMEWQIKAKSDITHVSFQIFIDKPGEINILNIHDILNKIDLSYVIKEQSDTHIDCFILFDSVLCKNDILNLSIGIHAENYLSDLIEKSKGYVFQVEMKTGNSVIGKNKETYIFPNTKKFKNLQATIKNHPDKKKIGNVIQSTVKKTNKIISLDLSCSKKYTGNYGAELTI